jgi:PLP dependent protein
MEGVIAANLAAVRGRIDAAARAARRAPDSVRLVAVSKTHPAAAVREALAAGHRLFGENRVQEAQAKYPALREAFPDLVLHLIGPLQTNKVRDAVAVCGVIETVDRPRLAQALAREMERCGRRQRSTDRRVERVRVFRETLARQADTKARPQAEKE